MLEAARRTVVTLRDDGSFAGRPDATFAYRTVRVLRLTACHVSLLPTFTPLNLHERGKFGPWEGPYFAWVRVKNGRLIRVPITSVDSDMLPWLPSWLSMRRPQHRSSYSDLLDRVSETARLELGIDVHVNALRFRHWCARNWQALGLSTNEIAHDLGCSPEVVDRVYLRTQAEEAVGRLGRAMDATASAPSVLR